MDATTATHLANDARRQELRNNVASIASEVKVTANLAAVISQANADARTRFDAKSAELAAIEAGAGPGVTDDFGYKEDILAAFITQALEGGTITQDLAAALRTLAGVVE